MEFELELTDAPGELAHALEQVAAHGANVLSVIHHHEAQEGDRVPVTLAVEVLEENAIRLIDGLARRYRLRRIDQDGGPARTSVLVTGHVFQARIDHLMDRVFDHGATVERVDARIHSRDEPSAVLLDVAAPSEPALQQALDTLRQEVAGAGLSLLESVRRDADA